MSSETSNGDEQRARAFCFTDFQSDRIEFWRTVTTSKVRYLILGREVCPTTGRIHLQGYIYFTNPRKFSTVRKSFGGTHIELARGSPADNRIYCAKGGNVVLEFGELPAQGTRTDISQLASRISEGASFKDIAEEYPTMVLKMPRGIEKLIEAVRRDEPRNWKSDVRVVWGVPGSGKSRYAIANGAIPVQYTSSGFWLGYSEGMENILIDDFQSDMFPRNYFLNLTDRYKFTVNIKGGSANWAPRTIWITSNFNPREWYGGDPAILRRINFIASFVGEKRLVIERNIELSEPTGSTAEWLESIKIESVSENTQVAR